VIPVLLPDADHAKDAAWATTFLDRCTWVEFNGSCDDEQALHRLVCGVKGVAPGPGPRRDSAETERRLVAQLRRLMTLRQANVITESRQRQFETRILERLLEA